MTAILRREFAAYFYSPIGYIYLAVYYFFAGLYFTGGTLRTQMADISTVFSGMFLIVLFLIPILTMRLLSEDKKNRTDQALLTAPIPLISLVMGKFLAAVTVYLMGLSVTIVYGVVVNVFTPPNWAMIWGNFIAMLLLGMALISIGMFISALTENQVIAATGGFTAGLFLFLVDGLAGTTENPVIHRLLLEISFSRRFSVFPSGIFNFSNIFFFFCVTAIFVVLTVRILEERRWS
jgi:ABC-2 type transport system permease protein